MAKSKRVQILMEPDEFALLTDIAQRRGSTVSELLRDAARTQFLMRAERARRREAAHRFLEHPDTALPIWPELEVEIESRRGPAVH